MHYFIDGYNMLFRILRAGDDLRTQRESLVEDLKLKISVLEIDTTLIFDSQYQPDEGSSWRKDTLEIIFTPQGETADEYILQELKELHNPAEHTVITSDKKLAWLCRRRLVKTEGVEEFISWLNKRYRNRLRQNKEKAQAEKPAAKLVKGLTPLLPDPKASHSLKASVKAVKASPEGDFDFYLSAFEKELEELGVKKEVEVKGRTKKPKIKTPKKPVDPEEAYLSDMERWERAFQKKGKEESDFDLNE